MWFQCGLEHYEMFSTFETLSLHLEVGCFLLFECIYHFFRGLKPQQLVAEFFFIH